MISNRTNWQHVGAVVAKLLHDLEHKFRTGPARARSVKRAESNRNRKDEK